jgi:glycosyltransferase involved in cell wall biosynthesis
VKHLSHRSEHSRLRVGLLLHGLDRPLSGVTRVALELGRALRASNECEVIFLETHAGGSPRDATDTRSVHLPGCGRVPGLMALGGPLVALAARRLRLDVVHDPVGVSPFTLGRWAGSYRRILTIHDANAFRFPEGYSWSNNLLHRWFVPSTLRNVDGVVTPSRHALSDLIYFLGLRSDRVWIVPHGVHSRFHLIEPDGASAVALSYGLAEPYLLYVGTRQPRKNLPILLAAFRRLLEVFPKYKLAIVGPGSPGDALEHHIRSLDLFSQVRLVGPVPDEDLPAIYAAAHMLVFPSLQEGFGLPVLEAMACGTPVVCSDATSLPEVAGDAAVLVRADDPKPLSEAMMRVLADRSLWLSLRSRGLDRARSFTWDRVARETVEIYRTVMARAPGSVRRGNDA